MIIIIIIIIIVIMASCDAGLGQKITDNFGEAKLLDDIIDHWDAGKPRLRPNLTPANLPNLSPNQLPIPTCNLSQPVTYPGLL